MVITFYYFLDVSPGGGKANLFNENRVVGLGCAFVPFQNVASAGIVIGERVGQGIICFLISADQFSQVPGAGHGVCARIQALEMIKGLNVFSIRPFLRGGFLKLHETQLAGTAVDRGFESAFPPDDRLD